MKLSVGIGLTNDCNLRCAHCYRDTERVTHLSLRQVRLICESLPVASMGLGTGENALNPEFSTILEYLRDRGIRLSLASNGYSLMALCDDRLRSFHDVELSVDFPTQTEQDAFRGEGNWRLIQESASRCHRLGIPVSVLATMMSVNYDRMDGLVRVAGEMGATLRVNAYQCVKTDRFRLSYRQFWEGYRRLFGAARVLSCSEPVVRAAMGLDGVRWPCSHTSLRINPWGKVIPCVYWPVEQGAPTVEELPGLGLAVLDAEGFGRARELPPTAANCRCRGGCASRRALRGALDDHDEYCPWVRGDSVELEWEPATAAELTRAGSLCTTILAPC